MNINKEAIQNAQLYYFANTQMGYLKADEQGYIKYELFKQYHLHFSKMLSNIDKLQKKQKTLSKKGQAKLHQFLIDLKKYILDVVHVGLILTLAEFEAALARYATQQNKEGYDIFMDLSEKMGLNKQTKKETQQSMKRRQIYVEKKEETYYVQSAQYEKNLVSTSSEYDFPYLETSKKEMQSDTISLKSQTNSQF